MHLKHFIVKFYSHLKNGNNGNKIEIVRNSRNGFENKYLTYDSFPEITEEELNQYKVTWPMFNIEKRDLTWARVCKKFWGFSPYIIGNWHTYLLREKYNPVAQLSSLENKALCDVYFPEIPYPIAFVRRINGMLFDNYMNPITITDAISILRAQKSYVIKPAFGTLKGEGVQVVKMNEVSNDLDDTIRQSFEKQKDDFIAQELIVQNENIAKLNPTSLNCCRITSLYINGKYQCSASQKFGKKGSFVDNWHSSYFCGVSDDGFMLDRAFDNHLQCVHKTDHGFVFGGYKLPLFAEMKSIVEKFHKKYFPNCGIIGWDVVVDINNKIRIIEANLTTPGIVIEQLSAGDFMHSIYGEICKSFDK